MADETTLDTRVWKSGSGWPELATDLPSRTAAVGICLSGGGTRAQCAGIGQLRGLRALGLLSRTRYLSAVSGGSWAATPFTYYASGSDGDGQFLGPVTAPEDISLSQLTDEIPRDQAIWTATQALNPTFVRLAGEVARPRVWSETVGELYFAPWGLHRDGLRFSHDDETVADIKARNPDLADADFAVVRADRPYLIVNGCILGDNALNPLQLVQPVALDMTPLYAGTARAHRMLCVSRNGQWREHDLGATLVEPFALGSPTPDAIADGSAKVQAPSRPWQLQDASGTSSAWFAGIAAKLAPNITEGFSPNVSLWGSGPKAAETCYDLGDGGVLENFGLLSLLRRKVPNIIVCANTSVPLNMDFDATERIATGKDLDAYLPPLFGFPLESIGVFTSRNQVFEPRGFVEMVRALQRAKEAGGPVVAVTELEVLDNDLWGIEGGWTVRIAWIYLDRSADFEAALGEDVRDEIARGHDTRLPPPMRGKLKSFPNVATANHNGPDLTQLTAAQARLLADYTCWTVLAAESLLGPLYE